MPSRTQIDRAGRTLRDFQTGGALFDPAEITAARDVVREYRGGHSYPLTKVSVSLRQFITTEERRAERRLLVEGPAQRLKRLNAITAKLVRQSTRLTQMEDVAGCRAVLVDLDAVRRVASRIGLNWKIEGEDDYFANPKEDGYRALHLRVRRDGYRIEIQLRTEIAHGWAELIDALTLTLAPRYDVKHEVAPADLLSELKRLADTLAEIENSTAARRPEVLSEVRSLLDRIKRQTADAMERER